MRTYTYQPSRSPQRNRRTRTPGSDRKTLLLFYILPFILINGIIFYLATAKPKFEITVGETHDYLTTDMTFTIKSYLPTKNLSASIDATPLELEETGRKTYKAVISQNGTLEVSLSNFNGMTTTEYVEIGILDDSLPTITERSIEDGLLTVVMADSQSGIDYTSIYAINSDGMRIVPLTIDKTKGRLTLSMDTQSLTLFVSDMSGNTMEQPISLSESEDEDE